jgi:hypothetical protein
MEALGSLTGLRQLSLCNDHGAGGGNQKRNDWQLLTKLSNLSYLCTVQWCGTCTWQCRWWYPRLSNQGGVWAAAN